MLGRWRLGGGLLWAARLPPTTPAPSPCSAPPVQVRQASSGRKWAVGPTKSAPNRTKGKMRGTKVYDGQRVPSGTVLVNQVQLRVYPGWNVRFGHMNKLIATCDGRAMMTTEVVDPDWNDYKVDKYLSKHLKTDKIFKHFVHVVPDEQHQYFRLVEQI